MIEFSTLQHKLNSNQVIPLTFAGNKLLLDASGAMVWPALDLLIFSDLHLEKGSFLSQFANPLPRFDSKDTILRMQAVMREYKCSNIVSLGDSFHDGNAVNRMQLQDLEALNALVKSVNSFTWVLGNHDPDVPSAVLGERAQHLKRQNVLLTHEPEKLETTACDAQIVGHFHPKSTQKLATRKVTGKCYLASHNIVLMPAFGSYTGGLCSTDKAFESLLCQKTMQTFLLFNKRIFLL